jgi:hypothetical protein
VTDRLPDGVAPDGIDDLDRRLRAIRFEPRASLGGEIAGRARRGESPLPPARPPSRRLIGAGVLAAGIALAMLLLPAVLRRPDVTVDRCCYDLDGGGTADDGVHIVARRDADVRQLLVYEDTDGSHTLSRADIVRLERGRTPALAAAGIHGLTTLERCCLDFDGGGRDDDGLLLLGVPPERVVMAAIFERTAEHRLPLR